MQVTGPYYWKQEMFWVGRCVAFLTFFNFKDKSIPATPSPKNKPKRNEGIFTLGRLDLIWKTYSIGTFLS